MGIVTIMSDETVLTELIPCAMVTRRIHRQPCNV